MGWTRSWIVAALSVAGGAVGGATPAVAEIDIAATIQAIQQYRCANQYWADPKPSPPPSVLPITIRSEGQIAHALVEGLDGPNWVTFYTITGEGSKAMVTSSWGYDKRLLKENAVFQEQWGRIFDDSSKHAFGGDFRIGELRVPSTCAFVLESDTAIKRAMVDAVRRSVAVSLTLFNMTGASYPARVRIVIANFNTDFGVTYVLIRETGEIFGVRLDDPVTDPPQNTKYLVFELYNPSDLPPIRGKIMTTGIEREIQLGK